MMLTLFILSYTLGAVVTYGAMFASVRERFIGISGECYWPDMAWSLFFGAMWLPLFIGIKVCRCRMCNETYKYGLKFY